MARATLLPQTLSSPGPRGQQERGARPPRGRPRNRLRSQETEESDNKTRGGAASHTRQDRRASSGDPDAAGGAATGLARARPSWGCAAAPPHARRGALRSGA